MATTARRFEGKTAIVTGAASGLGRAVCLRLAEEGGAVACIDLDGDGAQKTAATIGEAGGEADGVRNLSRDADGKTLSPFPDCNSRHDVSRRCGQRKEAVLTFQLS